MLTGWPVRERGVELRGLSRGKTMCELIDEATGR
jgi:hypothetical protein